VSEPERADAFRRSIDRIPARSLKRPPVKQGAAGLGVILAIVATVLSFTLSRAHSRPDNSRYLACIAQAQSPPDDPIGGDLGVAVSTCSGYPH